jgi:hypothetical protein
VKKNIIMIKLAFAAIAVGAIVLIIAAKVFSSPPEQKKMERYRLITKTGGGAIKKRIYVITNSPVNKITFPDGKRWQGAQFQVAQVVVVWRNQVVDMNALPKDFDIQESVIVSFHPTHVDFLDPEIGVIYYYDRDTSPPAFVDKDGNIIDPYK